MLPRDKMALGRCAKPAAASTARRGQKPEAFYTPRLAAEFELQPIRRYGFDAAILFSVVHDFEGHALGLRPETDRQRVGAHGKVVGIKRSPDLSEKMMNP